MEGHISKLSGLNIPSPSARLPEARRAKVGSLGAILALQRSAGNRAVASLLPAAKPGGDADRSFSVVGHPRGSERAFVQRDPVVVQREGGTPYPATHKPPDFEYWVNTMYQEVPDKAVKDQVVALLKGPSDTPRAGADLDVPTKSSALRTLYAAAYQERVWVPAAELIEEQSLKHQIQVPLNANASAPRTRTMAAGFHGTARDPKTVLKSHKGTVPTLERHGADGNNEKIKAFLTKELGIESWHPFWFGGDIATRPFLFRNVQGDNELDTTISVAKDYADSLDFPMIESMKPEQIDGYDEHGLPLTTTYIYLVGVTEGFGTSKHLQGDQKFGEGEIATQKLKPEDHLGYVRYKRRHGGGSRNDGYHYTRVFSDVLPGGRQLKITDKVRVILDGMRADGYNRCDASVFDLQKVYASLEADGKAAAASSLKNKFAAFKQKWTDDEWKKQAQKLDALVKAPTPRAKTIRENKYLLGVRSVLKL